MATVLKDPYSPTTEPTSSSPFAPYRQLVRDIAPLIPLLLAALDFLSDYSVDHGLHPYVTVLLAFSCGFLLFWRWRSIGHAESARIEEQARILLDGLHVDRKREAQDMLGLLQECQTLAIVGRPGSGKSEIASGEFAKLIGE